MKQEICKKHNQEHITLHCPDNPKRASFEDWMMNVKSWILIESSNEIEEGDLPDYGYADAYDRGESARRVAKKALKAGMEF